MALIPQQRLSQRREAVGLTRKPLSECQPGSTAQAEVWLDRAEFQELIRPAQSGTVEALRSDISTTAMPVPATEARSLAGSDARALARTRVLQRPEPSLISPGSAGSRGRLGTQRRLTRFTRFAAAGLLAVIGGAASVPLITPHSDSIAGVVVDNPAPSAPMAANPAPDLGSTQGEDSTGATVAAPDKPAGITAPSAAVRTPHPIRTVSRTRPPAIMTSPPAPRAPAIPAQAYAAWSRMAELSASHQDRERLRSEARRARND
jgi:hypothetical protein